MLSCMWPQFNMQVRTGKKKKINWHSKSYALRSLVGKHCEDRLYSEFSDKDIIHLRIGTGD